MYKIKTTDSFEKQFKKMDKSVQRIIAKWIKKHLIDCDDPRALGKGLSANLSGYWRYRIGDYRLLVEIIDTELIVITVDIGHRKDIYE